MVAGEVVWQCQLVEEKRRLVVLKDSCFLALSWNGFISRKESLVRLW